MITVSIQDAHNRYLTLPAILKDAIFSVEGADAIGRIQEANHLTNEKTTRLAKLSGYVLLGFLHREDLAKEIQESLAVSFDVGKVLAGELQKRILDQYKEELDHVFAPQQGERSEKKEESKIQQGPVMLGVGGMENVRPTAPIAPQITGSQIKSGMTSPSTGSGNMPPAPAPFIIERTTTAAPAPQKPGFRLDIPKPAATAKKEERPVTARLEIGGQTNIPPRVIHYSAMKTPIPTPPRINIGERSEKKEESSLPQPNLKPTVPPAIPKGPVPFDVAQGKSFAPASLPIKPPQTQIPGSPIPPEARLAPRGGKSGMTPNISPRRDTGQANPPAGGPPPVVKFSPSAPKPSTPKSADGTSGQAQPQRVAPPPIRSSAPSTSSGYKSSPQAPRMTPVPLEARHEASRPLMGPGEELPPPHGENEK